MRHAVGPAVGIGEDRGAAELKDGGRGHEIEIAGAGDLKVLGAAGR